MPKRGSEGQVGGQYEEIEVTTKIEQVTTESSFAMY